MHAADAAGREHPDPRRVRRPQGRGHRGRAGIAGGNAGGQVAEVELAHAGRGGQTLHLRGGKADAHRAVEHADGGRLGPGAAHLGLERRRGLQPLRMGQAMGDQRGLERHHRAAVAQRLEDPARDRERRLHVARARAPNHSSSRARADGGVAASSPAAPQSSSAKAAIATP